MLCRLLLPCYIAPVGRRALHLCPWGGSAFRSCLDTFLLRDKIICFMFLVQQSETFTEFLFRHFRTLCFDGKCLSIYSRIFFFLPTLVLTLSLEWRLNQIVSLFFFFRSLCFLQCSVVLRYCNQECDCSHCRALLSDMRP